MAKTGERVAGSNRDVVLRHLRDNPGHQRCTEIAEATGLSTHQVAIACYGMATETGELVRGERPASNGGRAFKTYAAAESVGAVGQGES